MLRALLVLTVLSSPAFADDEDLGNCKEEAFAATRIEPLRTVTYERDAKQRIVKKTSGTRVDAYTYDDRGRLTSIASDGTVILYDYDDKGRVAHVKELANDKLVRRWERRYDGKGLLARELAEENGKVTIDKQYTRDDKGRVAKLSMDKGAITETHTYDDKGHLVKNESVVGTKTIVFTYKYDAKGRRIEQANDKNRIVYSYDCKTR